MRAVWATEHQCKKTAKLFIKILTKTCQEGKHIGTLEIPTLHHSAALHTKIFKLLNASNKVTPITEYSKLAQATVCCVKYICVHTSQHERS